MELVQGTHKFRHKIKPRKPKRRWGRISAALVASVLIIAMGGYVWLARTHYVVAAELEQFTMPATDTPAIPWPESGTSAIGAAGHGLLADSGSAEQVMPIASITKLITAAVILEKKPLDPGQFGETITLTAADEGLTNNYAARGGSTVPLYAGQELSQYHALNALLLPSANNVADMLVIWAFGSMDNYLTYANAWVKSKGMNSTTVADASGFSPATTSSARDLIKLGDIALTHPVISEIVRKPHVALPGVGTVYSTNKLLGNNGIIGGKTGMTDEAGDCLLFIARHTPAGGEEVMILGVLLGQPSRPVNFAHAQAILSAARNGFVTTEILSAGQTIGRAPTLWNTTADLQSDQDITITHWKGSAVEVQTSIPDISAAKPAGYKVGTLTVQSGDLFYESAVSLKDALDQPPLWWRLRDKLGIT